MDGGLGVGEHILENDKKAVNKQKVLTRNPLFFISFSGSGGYKKGISFVHVVYEFPQMCGATLIVLYPIQAFL